MMYCLWLYVYRGRKGDHGCLLLPRMCKWISWLSVHLFEPFWVFFLQLQMRRRRKTAKSMGRSTITMTSGNPNLVACASVTTASLSVMRYSARSCQTVRRLSRPRESAALCATTSQVPAGWLVRQIYLHPEERWSLCVRFTPLIKLRYFILCLIFI